MKAKVLSQTTDDIGVRVVASIIPGPFVKVWRHPVWWWKMRHLRADLQSLQCDFPGGAEWARQIREEEDRAFLYGTGERTGP